GSVEAGPKGFFLAAAISEHLISSRSGNSGQLYHMVTEIPASFCSVPPHNVDKILFFPQEIPLLGVKSRFSQCTRSMYNDKA
ncbi:MAG TPA: hypothetical protein QF533_08230, partial [Nitrospinota bacterium]|nr:hypothetical protein [Nitrospinota bacterium]